MTFLLRRLDIGAEQPSAGNASPAVLDLLSRGDKAGGIRAYLDDAPCSLKDAKRYLESLRV